MPFRVQSASTRYFKPIAAGLAAVLAVALVAANGPRQQPAAPPDRQLPLPNREQSVKFMVLGDFGTGDKPQYEVAEQMVKVRSQFAASFVITVGDNIYGREGGQNLKKKFEDPYRGLLSAGVKFYASLGNHDSRNQARYALFNMGGKTFYRMKPDTGSVKFLALDSAYPTPQQIDWVKDELKGGEDWIVPYFHHPPYSSGARHGSDMNLRRALEPLFLGAHVTVVFTGHDHFYERIKPQQGITYFVVGSGGQLRKGNLKKNSPLTAKGFDTDRAFLCVEIDGDEMFFAAISRLGQVVDSGTIPRRKTAGG